MAIIPDVPHVAVDIVVDGRPLPEYLDEDDDDSISSDSTTKYVECVSGSRFGIRIDLTGLESKHLKRGNTVVADYHLDGTWVDGIVNRFPLGRRAVTLQSAAHHKEAGVRKARDFMFAELVTTEEGPSSKPIPELKDLGTITTKLFYAHTTWGKKGDLQTLYLIPRSPSPVSLEDRPEESLNREELLELLRRQKARQEEQIAIKKELKRERIEDDESNDESNDELVVVSSRPSTRKLKISADASTGIETIDLTDD
ncbi:hypothetical protein E4T49_04157 [Aureobasidium sp. EXF-10728]|nr:hypothetical protein E4T49_04157 [Aureobasidium sp. EXF-10728]